MPILIDDRVLACVTMIWIASALRFEEAVERNLGAVKRAVTRIQSLLQV